MIYYYLSLVILLTSLLNGCLFFDRHVEYEAVQPEHFPVLRAIGYAPISLQKGETAQQKMLLAIKASKAEAYLELAEQVYGYQVNGQGEIKSLVQKQDQLKTQVSGIIRGARVVKSYAVGDTYATELELDTQRIYQLFHVVNPKQRIKKVRYY